MLFSSMLAITASGCNSDSPEKPWEPPVKPGSKVLITANDVLTLDNTTGKLRKDGKDYYGAGVNYYDAFYRVVIDGTHNDTSYRNGIRVLQEKGIPFIRFSVLGFYPNDYNYYKNNEIDYFRRLDAFVNFAKDHNVGLIPSFFWNHSTVCDFVGETVNAWAKLDEPGNKTNTFMATYVEKMIKRYGNNPAIWAWEFGNEANIKTDPAGRRYDQQSWVYPITSSNAQGGLPTTRTFLDTLSTAELSAAYNKFQTLIREQEDKLELPHRAVFSGNTNTNYAAYSRFHHGKWDTNTKEQYEEMMILQNGNLGTVTIHPYLSNEGSTSFNTSMKNIIAGAKAICDREKKALFLGEFGVDANYGANTQVKWREYVDAIKDNDIQLSALWVFDTLGGETGYMKEWVVTPTFRAYQLDNLVEINNYFKSKYK